MLPPLILIMLPDY